MQNKPSQDITGSKEQARLYDAKALNITNDTYFELLNNYIYGFYSTCNYRQYRRERAVKRLNINDGHRILDIGCNLGGVLNYISHQYNIQGIGIDISFESLKIARILRPVKSLQYLKADSVQLPFQDNTFDSIISFDVIEHVKKDSQKDLIAEMGRVVKPGGKVLISCPNGQPWVSYPDISRLSLFYNDLKKPIEEKGTNSLGFYFGEMEPETGHYIHNLPDPHMITQQACKAKLLLEDVTFYEGLFASFYVMERNFAIRRFINRAFPLKKTNPNINSKVKPPTQDILLSKKPLNMNLTPKKIKLKSKIKRKIAGGFYYLLDVLDLSFYKFMVNDTSKYSGGMTAAYILKKSE